MTKYLRSPECEKFSRERGAGSVRQWSAYVCVEEPIDRSNAGRAIVRRDAFDRQEPAVNFKKKRKRNQFALFSLPSRILSALGRASKELRRPNTKLSDLLYG